MQDKKFELTQNLKERLAQGVHIGDVTTGECDFDHEPATQGRKVSQDVFYLCKRCVVKINS